MDSTVNKTEYRSKRNPTGKPRRPRQTAKKPHLHIKGANKLKMRFIPLNFSGICWVLTLYWLPTRIHL